VVESTALEMRHTGNRIGGSNPSLSAKTLFADVRRRAKNSLDAPILSALLVFYSFAAVRHNPQLDCGHDRFQNHVVDMALAHAVGDKVEAAYRRGDLFQKRRQLMDAWGSYCVKPPTGGEIVPLRAADSRLTGMSLGQKSMSQLPS
jgi:hypothetical protein